MQPNTEFFEAKIQFRSKKSYIVEMTLGGRYFIPYSCVVSLGEPDIDGNILFEVNRWLYNKIEDGEFKADD